MRSNWDLPNTQTQCVCRSYRGSCNVRELFSSFIYYQERSSIRVVWEVSNITSCEWRVDRLRIDEGGGEGLFIISIIMEHTDNIERSVLEVCEPK